jgi:hypothetical protein
VDRPVAELASEELAAVPAEPTTIAVVEKTTTETTIYIDSSSMRA